MLLHARALRTLRVGPADESGEEVATVADLTGVTPFATTVDGCGAPLFGSTPAGLARAFGRLAVAGPGTPEGRVAASMRAHPWWVGGSSRPVTRLAQAVPGLIAKDGAEVAQLVEAVTEEQARAIGEAAQRRVLAHHTYTARAKQVEALLTAEPAALSAATL